MIISVLWMSATRILFSSPRNKIFVFFSDSSPPPPPAQHKLSAMALQVFHLWLQGVWRFLVCNGLCHTDSINEIWNRWNVFVCAYLVVVCLLQDTKCLHKVVTVGSRRGRCAFFWLKCGGDRLYGCSWWLWLCSRFATRAPPFFHGRNFSFGVYPILCLIIFMETLKFQLWFSDYWR